VSDLPPSNFFCSFFFCFKLKTINNLFPWHPPLLKNKKLAYPHTSQQEKNPSSFFFCLFIRCSLQPWNCFNYFPLFVVVSQQQQFPQHTKICTLCDQIIHTTTISSKNISNNLVFFIDSIQRMSGISLKKPKTKEIIF
jgi:hypothetical protein